MKKILSLIVVLALVCSMLCGCFLNTADIKINADGSGVFKTFTGYTKDGLVEYLRMMEEDVSVDDVMRSLEKINYNGVTYYGETKVLDFNKVDELAYGLTEDVKIIDNGYGSFKVVVKAGIIDERESQELEELYGMTSEDIYDSMVILYDIEFPHNVLKVYGDNIKGIEVQRNKLHINPIEVSRNCKYSTELFVFETVKDGEKAEDKILKFTDVVKNQWFYQPVMTLANGGLVQGKGNGIFDPDGTLTYAEFCQLIAKMQDMEYGEENGYWAAKAIKSCVDEEYINDLGEVTPSNYDIPITREAAIAAMFRAVGYYTDENEYTEENIPDFKLISEEYCEDIIGAYNFGITQGKDENMTFDPKGTLTRAEVCQLLYNIGCVVAL